MILTLLLVALFVGDVKGRSVSERSVETNGTNCWDYFLLVQRWPYSSCQIVNASGTPCVIPDNIDSWTLHGLWPGNINSWPEFCTNEMFNMTLVEDLKDELLVKWPNLYLNESEDSLWKHEYEKHGTCAEQLENFATERDYFVNTMKFFDQYRVEKVLEKNGIFPREEPFDTKMFIETMQSGFDTVICPWCGYIKDFGQVISQVGICIDKTNRVVNCPACEKPCNKDEPVYYQPNHPAIWANMEDVPYVITNDHAQL